MNASEVQREHGAVRGAHRRLAAVLSQDPFRAVRICLGLLLLTAAGLKTHQLATEPVLGNGLLDSRSL